MGQVQNGHLCIRYNISSTKKQRMQKPTDYITLLFSLTFHKVEKSKREISILFVFLFLTHNSKNIWCIKGTYQMISLPLSIFLSSFGATLSYDWRTSASKLSPKTHHALVQQLLGLSHSRRSTWSGHTWATECVLQVEVRL